jgi:hypothetical protein
MTSAVSFLSIRTFLESLEFHTDVAASGLLQRMLRHPRHITYIVYHSKNIEKMEVPSRGQRRHRARWPSWPDNSGRLGLHRVLSLQTNRMVCQNSAGVEEGEAENSRELMQEQAVAAGDHRIACRSEPATSQTQELFESMLKRLGFL